MMVIVFYTGTHYNIVMHQFWEECGHIVSPVSRFTHYIIPENTWRLVHFNMKGMITSMKIAAVIAEYNPFHNGHLYQLQNIREELGADRILVIMSGNFMQRGIPAIVDKYLRTRMALENGADVVLELPVYYSLGSAEYFAQGAVSLLDKLGVIDYLHFGSECGNLQSLQEIASILSSESDTYVTYLKEYQKKGESFASARYYALMQELSSEKAALTKEPNNTLAIEYIKALMMRQSSIQPVTLKRQGNGYNAPSLNNELASASAIRNFMQDKQADYVRLADQVPSSVYSSLMDNQEYLYVDDFSSILYYKLISSFHAGHDLSDIYDMTESLSDTFRKHLPEYTSFQQFCLDCKTRNVTFTRIARSLMHILLDMDQETANQLKENDYTFYAHLLGFNDKGRDVLKATKGNSSIPVFTRLPEMLKKLDGAALTSLQADIYASQLYYGVQGQKYHHTPINEFRLKYNPC